MQYLRHSGWRFVVALVAAYMLALQSVVGAFALGLGPNPAQLDAFGHPLCITSTDQSDQNPSGAEHHLPNCCTLACKMFAPLLPVDRGVASVILILDGRTDALPLLYEDAPASDQRHSPANPRAPPVTA